jgi:hypothetical protein
MLRYSLIVALGASLAAILGFWLWWQAREQVAALRAENRGLHEAARVTSKFIEESAERNAAVLDAIGELRNVAETNVCMDTPALRAVGERLRR